MTVLLRPSLAVFLVLVLKLATAAPKDCEINGKSVNPDNGNTTAGLTGIMRCLDRESKELVREQEVQNGAFFGLERFYEKGKLQRDFRTNIKGNKEGNSKTYAAGVLVADEQYQSGSNVGLQKYFFESGALQRLTFYEITRPISPDSPFIETRERASITLNKNGKLSDVRCANKPVIEFEKINDQKLCGFQGEVQLELFSGDALDMRKSFLNGEVTATASYWGTGKIRSEMAIRDSKYFENRFNQAGLKLKEIVAKVTVVQGGSRRVKELERDFHPGGTMVAESRWLNEELVQEKTWYLNGQPKTQLDYQGPAFIRNDFHDNGVLAFKGGYSNARSGARAVGEHQSFDDNGRLRLVRVYDDKGQVTREREHNETGVVVRDDALFEDGSRKAFSR
jgi:antitoxin component YwqK of YwqJK toxin-antitoxin module